MTAVTSIGGKVGKEDWPCRQMPGNIKSRHAATRNAVALVGFKYLTVNYAIGFNSGMER
jgi:hypothetical protein